MDKKPFLEWDLLTGGPIPFEFLTILQRSEYKPEQIKTFATEKSRQSVLVTELTRLLEESDEFVRFVLQNTPLESRNLSTRVVQEWRPILKGAIREWVKHHALKVAMGDRPHEVAPTEAIEKTVPPGDQYVEFWQPIRSEPNGRFAGKPKPENRIFIACRPGISVGLVVRQHATFVEIGVDKTNNCEKVLRLLPQELTSTCERKEVSNGSLLVFPVLDKGLADRGNWPEIRQKLKKCGEEVYELLKNSSL